MTNIEKALKILEPFYRKAPVADYRNWIETRRRWYPEEEPEVPGDNGMEFYCNKCIKRAMKEYKKTHPDVIVLSNWDQNPENEGFIACYDCGIHIQCGLLLDSQEIEHWESLKDKEIDITNNGIAYELYEILDGFRFIDEDLKERVKKLAERIIAIKEGKI